MDHSFLIGDLARQARVNPKTIRYYEQIGLLPPPKREANGYRVYDESDVVRLQFIRHARALDLPLDDIEEILAFRERVGHFGTLVLTRAYADWSADITMKTSPSVTS